MKTKLTIIFGWLAILTISLVILNLPIRPLSNEGTGGAVGSKLLENYLPYVKFNDGIFSNLSMQITGSSTFANIMNLNGTTTINKSYDGFVAWDNFTMGTGTAKAVYTNPGGGDMWCNGANGGVLFDNTTLHQAPALQFSMGTSTSATGYSTNLIASTTVATSSDQVFGITYTANWLLKIGESIVANLSDTQGTNSSSTNYGNWSAEFGFGCRLIGA